jgi:hypothetical protein
MRLSSFPSREAAMAFSVSSARILSVRSFISRAAVAAAAVAAVAAVEVEAMSEEATTEAAGGSTVAGGAGVVDVFAFFAFLAGVLTSAVRF